MKMLGRICVILLAALVVVGVTFAVSRTTSATSANTGFSRGAEQGQNGGAPPAQGNNVRGGPQRGQNGGGGLFSLFDIGKNVAIIAVIVAIVAPISAWISKRKQRSVTKQQAPPDPTLST